jgi:hypothetical protein
MMIECPSIVQVQGHGEFAAALTAPTSLLVILDIC